jgi:hypothetical protein
MPSLRSLNSTVAPPKIGTPTKTFFIQSTTTGHQNGGCCCLWTVPVNTTRVTFEMWAAGGDGSGGFCCDSSSLGATAGSYSIIQIDATAGRQYRLCAAGSGCCTYCGDVGNTGSPSYVFGITENAVVACAAGGRGGDNSPGRYGSGEGYTCCWGRISTCGVGDISFPGAGGTGIKNQYCHSNTYHIVGSSHLSGGGRTSPDRCSMWACNGHNIMKSTTAFPGGPGGDPNVCGGGFCYGQYGQGGMIKVSYS